MDILELFKVIIIGIVEGITEWLPISSTGHMILVEEFIKLKSFSDESFSEMFNVVIQLGAIFAVILLFWNKLWPFRKQEQGGLPIDKDRFILWVKIVVACIPSGIIGILLEDQIDNFFYAEGRNIITICITLLVYGIAFIVIENWHKSKTPTYANLNTLPYRIAFLIGCFQVLAMIPGTSRSGITIIGAILLGTSREVAAEFTFFLAIPTMAGASLLKLIKYNFAFTGTQYAILLTGMLTAFLVSIVCIRMLMAYIRRHDFKVFGWYRIVLSVVVFTYFYLIH